MKKSIIKKAVVCLLITVLGISFAMPSFAATKCTSGKCVKNGTCVSTCANAKKTPKKVMGKQNGGKAAPKISGNTTGSNAVKAAINSKKCQNLKCPNGNNCTGVCTNNGARPKDGTGKQMGKGQGNNSRGNCRR